MFKLEFSTDNDAFADDPRHEVARVLRKIAADIEAAPQHAALEIGASIKDENGNTVGAWSLKVEG